MSQINVPFEVLESFSFSPPQHAFFHAFWASVFNKQWKTKINNPCRELNTVNKYWNTGAPPSMAKMANTHVRPNIITKVTAPRRRDEVLVESVLLRFLVDAPQSWRRTRKNTMKFMMIMMATGARKEAKNGIGFSQHLDRDQTLSQIVSTEVYLNIQGHQFSWVWFTSQCQG